MARFEVYGNRLAVRRPDGSDAPGGILQIFDLDDLAKPVEFRLPSKRAK
jgi:hypothetical protein